MPNFVIILHPIPSSDMNSSQILSLLLPYALVGLCDHIRFHAPCPVVKRFEAMPIADERNCLYDTRNGVERLSAIGC